MFLKILIVGLITVGVIIFDIWFLFKMVEKEKKEINNLYNEILRQIRGGNHDRKTKKDA